MCLITHTGTHNRQHGSRRVEHPFGHILNKVITNIKTIVFTLNENMQGLADKNDSSK